MRTIDLQRAWPEYRATHNISDVELERIARAASTVADAQRIWEEEKWWCPELQATYDYDFGDGAGPVPARQHCNGGGWVALTATVAGDAYVGRDAVVYGRATVDGDAVVDGHAEISGTALVCGPVADDAVDGDSIVYADGSIEVA